MENALTGVLFLTGIVVGSWLSGTAIVGVGAVVGLLVSTIAAHIYYKDKETEQGLHGFNGILVGCALSTFFGSTWPMWLALVVLSALSPFLRKAMNRPLEKLGINSLTFPFIVLTWLSFCFDLSTTEDSATSFYIINYKFSIALSSWLNGISQVFLVCSPICGALFLAGLLVADRRAAAWCAIGSAIGLALAFLFGEDATSISNGLYGFNTALTAVALGAVFQKNAITTCLGVISTFFIQLALSWLLAFVGIPALTAPFCLATWIFLVNIKLCRKI